MRTTWDSLRSVQRYVSEALGPNWEVSVSNDRGEFEYPYSRVSFVGDVLSAGPALYALLTQPMTISCHLEPAESVTASSRAADAVRMALVDAFQVRGVGLGRPRRVPLYDYDAVADSEQSYERHPSDFLTVADFSARLLPDPEEPRRIPVVCDLRVSWHRAGRVPYGDTQPVESVRYEPQTS